MTVELSPPTTQPKAASSTAHGGKPGKAHGAQPADAGATGFMAVLGALGDAPADDSATALGQAGDPAAALPAADDVPVDATTLLQQNPQIAAAQAVLPIPVSAPASAKGSAVSDAAIGAIGQDASAIPRAVGLQDRDTTGPRADPAKLPAAADGGQERARQAIAAHRPSDVVPTEGKAPAESGTDVLQHASVHSKAARDAALKANDSSTGTASTSTAASTERIEPKDSRILAALESVRTVARAPEPALTPLQPRVEKTQAERNASNAKSPEPTYTAAPLGVSSPDFSQATGVVGALAPEMQVAEQVSYWVSHNVQNAELKLDGLGQNPVEVRISVQGNEAQITFRSDEAQTRGVLEGAGAHLKDMLHREGMVLTGVSVGTSGGGGSAGDGERRGRPPVRLTRIAPLEAVATAAAQRSTGASGRSVDLFV